MRPEEPLGALGVGVEGLPGVRRADVHERGQPPALQHGGPVAQPLDHVQLVAHQQDGGAQFGPHAAEDPHHLLGVVSVQCGGGLITQQHVRLGHQGPGDRHPLPLPTGELTGVLVRVRGHPDEVQQLHHTRALGLPRGCTRRLRRCVPAAAIRLTAPPRQAQGHGGIGVHRLVGQEVELLEDHADPAAASASGGDRERGEVGALHQDAALRGGLQAVDQAQQGGLAGAGFAHHPEDLSGGDLQVDALQGMHGAGPAACGVGLGDPAELDERGGCGGRGGGGARIRDCCSAHLACPGLSTATPDCSDLLPWTELTAPDPRTVPGRGSSA